MQGPDVELLQRRLCVVRQLEMTTTTECLATRGQCIYMRCAASLPFALQVACLLIVT